MKEETSIFCCCICLEACGDNFEVLKDGRRVHKLCLVNTFDKYAHLVNGFDENGKLIKKE